MARNKQKHHGRRGFTIPVAVVAGLAPTAMDTWHAFRNNGTDGARKAMGVLSYNLAGIDESGRFRLEGIMHGYGPILAGFIVHKLASKFGVNKAIASAGIPLVRI